jgi:hypothetical protein
MIEFTETVTIRGSVAEVVAVLCAVERWPQWHPAVDRVDRSASGPLRVGETATVKQPRLPAAAWTVTAVDDGGFTWTSTGVGVRSTGEHRAVAGGGGHTTATLVLRLDGPLSRVVAVFYSGLIRRYVAMEAAGLRAAVEGR